MRIGSVISIQQTGFAPRPPARPQSGTITLAAVAPVAATLAPPSRGDAACLTLLMAQSFGVRVMTTARARPYGPAEPADPIFSLTA